MPGIAKLDFLSTLEVRGADAAAFLHAQLCGDVLELPPGQCRFTAWCTPKGRVIASFLLARGASGFRLILCRDIAARVLQRLRLYVLRSRVELVDRGGELMVAGGSGEAPTAPVSGAAREWEYGEQGDLAAAVLPGVNHTRLLLLGTPSALAEHPPSIEAAPGWALEDIRTGIPWIGVALSEEFLPQELDLERLRGLSYTKGCFPGQEIIARVHARGRQKRSLHRFTAAAPPPAPGAKLIAADGTMAGRVIAAARGAPGSCAGLAVSDLERADREPLHLDPGGTPVRFDVRGPD